MTPRPAGALPVHARTEALLRWAQALNEHRDTVAELVARESGALRREAAADVDRAVDCVRYYAGLVGKVDGRTLSGIPGHLGHTAREHHGVVAGLNSWNSALSMFARQSAPALACGNGYVLGADPTAPLGPTLMAHLAQRAGVEAVAVLTGRGGTGPYLAGHPKVGMIAFTGSAEDGREIIRASAGPVAPLTVGLASRNSAFVLAGADLGTAVPCVLYSRFSCAGQNWYGAAHVHVHVSLYEEFVEAAVSLARRLRIGPPLADGTHIGPLVSEDARDRVETAVAAGVAAGARVRTGGRRAPRPDGGAYFEPTVVTDATPANPLRARLVAGPVLTVSSFEDAGTAAAEANATRSGGIAQIWGREAGAVQELAGRLEVGTVWINTHDALSPEIPMTPWGGSGYGAAGGLDALDENTRTKAVVWDLTPLSERTPPLTRTGSGTDPERPAHA
ncbi:aldehyde dehydrogenase family protein [Streptomyces sp. MMCC 100]|uniref:aldehyde dehydrogenase family protein n=1 Tax=Streptomyces sp. MMCC 100 TaxID=3163555 RepID=UPI003597A6FE